MEPLWRSSQVMGTQEAQEANELAMASRFRRRAYRVGRRTAAEGGRGADAGDVAPQAVVAAHMCHATWCLSQCSEAVACLTGAHRLPSECLRMWLRISRAAFRADFQREVEEVNALQTKLLEERIVASLLAKERERAWHVPLPRPCIAVARRGDMRCHSAQESLERGRVSPRRRESEAQVAKEAKGGQKLARLWAVSDTTQSRFPVSDTLAVLLLACVLVGLPATPKDIGEQSGARGLSLIMASRTYLAYHIIYLMDRDKSSTPRDPGALRHTGR